MIPWLTCLRVQVRHLRPLPILLDIVARAAIGALTLFIVLLASFQPFNAVTFEAGLRYDSREVVDEVTGDGISVVMGGNSLVMSETAFDAPGRSPGDFSASQQPRLWVYSGDRPPAPLLGTNIIEGALPPGGTAVDDAVAAALQIGAGDSVVVHTLGAGDCRLTVDAVTRSYNEITGDAAQGLLVLPSGVCAEADRAIDDGATIVRFDGTAPSGAAQTWSDRVLATLVAASDTQVTGLLIPTLVVGLVFWVLLGLRSSARVFEQLRPTSELLFDLGCRPARIRHAHLLVAAAMTLAAALIAGWAAREALWFLASFYIQPPHWVTVTLLFAVVTIAFDLASHRRAARQSSRRPLQASNELRHTPRTSEGMR